MRVCHRCRAPWEDSGAPGFNNTCAGCGMPLHACRNCVHFVSQGSIRCLVPQAQDVLDPSAGNRCQHFEFAHEAPARSEAPGMVGRAWTTGAARTTQQDQEAARRKWAELFGES